MIWVNSFGHVGGEKLNLPIDENNRMLYYIKFA